MNPHSALPPLKRLSCHSQTPPIPMPIQDLLRQRRFWFKTHSLLGLFCGGFLAVIGLTGALGVYGEGLDQLLNPGLHARKDARPLPLETHYATLLRLYPDQTGAWTLFLPREPGEVLTAVAERPRLSPNPQFKPLLISLDPGTSEVLAERERGWTLRTFLLKVHTHLLAGSLGSTLVGLLGVALLAGASMGLGLWLTQGRPVKERFQLRHKRGALRFASDLHHLMGLFLGPVFLLIAFTGINLSFPEVSEALLGAKDLGHADQTKPIQSTGSHSATQRVKLDEAVLLARGPFPRAEVRSVTTPEGQNGSLQVHFKQASEPNDRHPLTAVWIDAYSGQILEVRNPLRFNRSETLETLLWPIHTGEWAGGGWRLVWFAAGLSLPVFFATGLVRWLIRTHRLNDRPVEFENALHAAQKAVLMGIEKLRNLRT